MSKMIENLSLEKEERMPDLDIVMKDVMSRMDDIMAFMEMLSLIRSSGIMDFLRAILENREDVTRIVVDEASKKVNMNFIRNALSIYTFLSSIDPDVMRNFMKNAGESLTSAKMTKQTDGIGIMKLYSIIKQPGTFEAMRIMLKILSGLAPEEKKK